MAKILGRTSAASRRVLRAWCGVALVCAAAVALAYALESWVVGSGDAGLGRWLVLGLATASGLFVAAGVLRLTTWRLQRDAHSALIGTALVLMGAVCLPLGGFARLFASAENSTLVGLATRAVASILVMWLIIRGLRAADVEARARPELLLPSLLVLVVAVFMVLLALDDAVSGEIAVAAPRVVLSGVLALGWAFVAMRAAKHASHTPWARRASPLFLGMGVAEVLRALDHGRFDTWTLGGVLVCASMATLALRSALIDLDHVVRSDEVERRHLSERLNRVSGEADELSHWREQLTHDARNACAGLRAAMEILEHYRGRVDASTMASLRGAALQEIGQIEHLLFRSSSQPCEPFDVGEVVATVCSTARSLGARVEATGVAAYGMGRPGDLAAVLKNLLVNAQTHAPGSRVQVRVAVAGDRVTIICADDGPGLSHADTARLFERGYRASTRPGSGLGLYAGRQLMRDQGGDLELCSAGPGASFLITLPAAAPVLSDPAPRLPAQRTSSAVAAGHGLAGSSPPRSSDRDLAEATS